MLILGVGIGRFLDYCLYVQSVQEASQEVYKYQTHRFLQSSSLISSGFSVTLLSLVSLYSYRLSVETLGQMHSMVDQLIMDLHLHHM